MVQEVIQNELQVIIDWFMTGFDIKNNKYFYNCITNEMRKRAFAAS